MKGFIQIDRAVFETDIISDPLAFRLYMLIAKEAVYAEQGVKVRGMQIKRGQWLRSYRNLSQDLEYKERRGYKSPAISTIKRAIAKLKEYGLVAISETRFGTLFSLVDETEENPDAASDEDCGKPVDKAVDNSQTERPTEHKDDTEPQSNETLTPDLQNKTKERRKKNLKDIKSTYAPARDDNPPPLSSQENNSKTNHKPPEPPLQKEDFVFYDWVNQQKRRQAAT